MKIQVSAFVLVSMMASLPQAAWAMEEDYYEREKKQKNISSITEPGPQKKLKEDEEKELKIDKTYGREPLKSKFRLTEGKFAAFGSVWETLDLLQWAKQDKLNEAEIERLCESIVKDYLPKETLKGIDFEKLLMSIPPENWSDARIITAVLHLPYKHAEDNRETDQRMPAAFPPFASLSTLEDGEEIDPRINMLKVVIEKIKERADRREAEAQYIYGLIFQEWLKRIRHTPVSDSKKTEISKQALEYLTLAAQQNHPLALYHLSKNAYRMNAELPKSHVSPLFSGQESTIDDEEIDEAEEDLNGLRAEIEKCVGLARDCMSRVHEYGRNKLPDVRMLWRFNSVFHPIMSEEQMATFISHLEMSIKLGDLRAISRIEGLKLRIERSKKQEGSNITDKEYFLEHHFYTLLAHKAGFDIATGDLAILYDSPGSRLYDYKKFIKYEAQQFSKAVSQSKKKKYHEGRQIALKNHFYLSPLLAEKPLIACEVDSHPFMVQLHNMNQFFGALHRRSKHAVFNDSSKNTFIEEKCKKIEDFLIKCKTFVEKVMSKPGLLFPGLFRTSEQPVKFVGYRLNGRYYTSVISKLRNLDAQADKRFFDEVMALKNANDKALHLLRNNNEELLHLSNADDFSSQLLADYTHASTKEEKALAKAAALKFAEELNENLTPHIEFSQKFTASLHEFINGYEPYLLELCKKAYPFLFECNEKEFRLAPQSHQQ